MLESCLQRSCRPHWEVCWGVYRTCWEAALGGASSKTLGAPQRVTWMYCKLCVRDFTCSQLRQVSSLLIFPLSHFSFSMVTLEWPQAFGGFKTQQKLDLPTITCWVFGSSMIPFLFSFDKCCVKNKLPSVKNTEVCGRGSCTEEVLISCYAKHNTLK